MNTTGTDSVVKANYVIVMIEVSKKQSVKLVRLVKSVSSTLLHQSDHTPQGKNIMVARVVHLLNDL